VIARFDGGWAQVLYVDGGNVGVDVDVASATNGEAHAITSLPGTNQRAFWYRPPDGGFRMASLDTRNIVAARVAGTPQKAAATLQIALGGSRFELWERTFENGVWLPARQLDRGTQTATGLDLGGVSIDGEGRTTYLFYEINASGQYAIWRRIDACSLSAPALVSVVPMTNYLLAAFYNRAGEGFVRWGSYGPGMQVGRFLPDGRIGSLTSLIGSRPRSTPNEAFIADDGTVRVVHDARVAVNRRGSSVWSEFDLTGRAPVSVAFNALGDGYAVSWAGSAVSAAQLRGDGTIGAWRPVPMPPTLTTIQNVQAAVSDSAELLVVVAGADAGYGLYANSCR